MNYLITNRNELIILLTWIRINYLPAKFQINILKSKKVIKLLKLCQLWLKEGKNGNNSEYKSIVIQH